MLGRGRDSDTVADSGGPALYRGTEYIKLLNYEVTSCTPPQTVFDGSGWFLTLHIMLSGNTLCCVLTFRLMSWLFSLTCMQAASWDTTSAECKYVAFRPINSCLIAFTSEAADAGLFT